MAMKLILTITFLCLAAFQGLEAQSVLICRQKISQLQLEISTVRSQAILNVSMTASEINRNIAVARSSIRNALFSLKVKANTAVAPAAQICRDRLGTDLAAINEQNLNICYNNAQINILKQKINQQVGLLKNSANLICQSCADDVCVDAQVEEVRQQAQNVQQGGSTEADAIQEASSKCTDSVANEQLETIRNASDSFDECIQGIPSK